MKKIIFIICYSSTIVLHAEQLYRRSEQLELNKLTSSARHQKTKKVNREDKINSLATHRDAADAAAKHAKLLSAK